MLELFLHHPLAEPALIARILGPAAGARPRRRRSPATRCAPTPGACGWRWWPSRAPARRAAAAARPAAPRPARLRDGGDGGGAGRGGGRARPISSAPTAPPARGGRRGGRGAGAPSSPRRSTRSWGISAGATPAEMPALLHGIGYRAFARTRGRGAAPPPARSAPRSAPRDVEPLARDLRLRPRLRHRGPPAAPPPLRRRDVGTRSTRTVFTSGDAVTVLPFDPRRGDGAPDRAVPRRAARPPRSAALVPRDRRRALRPAGDAGGDRPARGARGGGARARPAGADRRLLSLARHHGRAHHRLRRRGRPRAAPAARTGWPTEHEDIRALVVPLDAALAAVASGEVNNAPLLISLLWLAQHRARLAAAWG